VCWRRREPAQDPIERDETLVIMSTLLEIRADARAVRALLEEDDGRGEEEEERGET
jgi:hypothetical protein